MEIKDNQLLRQFEVQTDSGLLAMEYAIQERKLFLTKLNQPEELEVEYINDFIKMVLSIAIDRKLKVVPTNPKLAHFFRKNPIYKELLPPGIKL
jgi:pantothenate kinase type III